MPAPPCALYHDVCSLGESLAQTAPSELYPKQDSSPTSPPYWMHCCDEVKHGTSSIPV